MSFVEERPLVEERMLLDVLVLLVAVDPAELGGHEYGWCQVNALRPSHKGVPPPFPMDGEDVTVASPLTA